MNGYYLIGEHLGHSFSADIHRRFGRYDYELKELSPAELGPFLEARDFAGLNVTIPYKEAVLPYLDRLDEQAAAIGAVNTVVNRGGVLWGYNTDFGGMEAALRRLSETRTAECRPYSLLNVESPCLRRAANDRPYNLPDVDSPCLGRAADDRPYNLPDVESPCLGRTAECRPYSLLNVESPCLGRAANDRPYNLPDVDSPCLGRAANDRPYNLPDVESPRLGRAADGRPYNLPDVESPCLGRAADDRPYNLPDVDSPCLGRAADDRPYRISPFSGKTVLILGTGGTSKTALAVCRALGAAEIFRVSRTGREGALSYEQAAARFGAPPHPSPVCALVPPTEQRIPFPQHSCANGDKISLSTGQLCPQGEGFAGEGFTVEGFTVEGFTVEGFTGEGSAGEGSAGEGSGLVVINCTPAGMWPDMVGLPLETAGFPNLSAVFDCVYNPLRTRLVLEAQARGIPAAGGLYMLVKQAALACELFTGEPVADAQIDIIYHSLRREQENIVLIGMPGAGKTTVGRILAQKTGKEFWDIDEEIVRRAGKPIPSIFAEAGEAGFRKLEAEVVREFSGRNGLVIATGGGTVLREENVRLLKHYGRLVFLDRPLAALQPSGDRPLGDTAEKLARLYAERRPIYLAAADEVVPVNDTPEAVAERIAP